MKDFESTCRRLWFHVAYNLPGDNSLLFASSRRNLPGDARIVGNIRNGSYLGSDNDYRYYHDDKGKSH